MNKKRKNAKKSFISSVISLILCVAMLVGTTFAWFTDTASTGVNKIQAGTLKIGFEMKDPTVTGGWKNAEGESLSWQKLGAVEGDEVIWEPGARYQLPTLKITNNGNLALQFQILISSISGDMDLLNALEFTCTYASVEEDSTSTPVTIQGSEIVNLPYELPRDPDSGITEDQVAEFGIKGNMLPNKEYALDVEGINVAYYTIEAHMKEDAGNQYQGLSLNDIAVTVVATQIASYEYDSFDNTYDKDAEYPVVVADATALKDALATGQNVRLANDIVLSEPITINGNVDFVGDGNSVITNKPLYVDETANVNFDNVNFATPTNDSNNASSVYASIIHSN